MKNLCKWILIVAILIGGCTEDQLRKGDKIVGDVNTVAQGAQAALESPAGQMVPPEWKLYGVLGIGLANGLIITWEEWRNRQMKKTTKAIVKGIESADNPDKATSEVKDNIRHEMLQEGGHKFYKRANKIVDRLKIA